MVIILILCLFFALQINAGVISTSSPFNMTEELAKIGESCLSDEEHDELSGNQYKLEWAREFNYWTIYLSLEVIGYSEMQKALGFSQYSGTYQNHKQPSNEELDGASNSEEYFEMITLGGISSSAELYSITDEELITSIQFLDKKWPAIRIIYRNKFEEHMEAIKSHKEFQNAIMKKTESNKWKIDRKVMDSLFYEYISIWQEIWRATKDNKQCQKYTRPDTSFLFHKTLKGCAKHTCVCSGKV